MKYDIYLYGKKNIAPWHKKAMNEYLKRLSRYCKIKCTVISKQKDWERAWDGIYHRVLLLPGNDSVSSETFSQMLSSWEMGGYNKVAFFVPDLSEQKEWCVRCRLEGTDFQILNLSNLSLVTGLGGVVLAEQIYRGYRIMHNHPYHK